MTDPDASAADSGPSLNPFGQVPRSTWRQKVEVDLKGRPFASLEGEDPEGLARQVLYTLEDAPSALPAPGAGPFARGTAGPRARIVPRRRLEAGSETGLGERIAEDRALGAELVWLEAPGLQRVRLGELGEAEGLRLVLDADAPAPEGAEGGGILRDLLAPIYAGRADAIDPAWIESALEAGGERPLVLDLRPVHEAGGGPVQVIRAALGAGLALLRSAEAAGRPLEAVAGSTIFAVSAELHFFDCIATLRALRQAWADLLRACGVEGERAAMFQRVDTGRRDLSPLDAWVNVLRGATSCFAAQVGGAQWIGVDPFDAQVSRRDLAERLAVNTQVVLREESHAAAVADPGGGSHFVEARTRQLHAAGWTAFTGDEAASGWLHALVEGELDAELGKLFAQRAAALAQGRSVRVGVSRFPEVLDPKAVAPQAPVAEGGRLPARRLAEAFEALRQASAEPPRMLLLPLGPLRAYKARADFARDLLAAGGVALIDEGPLDDPLARLRQGDVHGVVVAGSDEAYTEAGELICAVGRLEGCLVGLVARPAKGEEPLAVDLRLHMRADATELCGVIHAHAKGRGIHTHATGAGEADSASPQGPSKGGAA